MHRFLWTGQAYTPLLLAAALVGISFAADQFRIYRDAEYGLMFSYPAPWSPGANCNVAVQRIPNTQNQTQEQLNRGLDGKEFEKDYWLRDMPKNTRVFDSRIISLGPHAARTAVLDYSATLQGYTGYATQLHLVTLAPGLFVHLTCGSQGDTPEEGRAGFTYWKATFSRIAQSLKLAPTK